MSLSKESVFSTEKKILRKIISPFKICRITVAESLGMESNSGDHQVCHPAKSTVNNSSLLGFFLFYFSTAFYFSWTLRATDSLKCANSQAV